jgi:hypothetical protein
MTAEGVSKPQRPPTPPLAAKRSSNKTVFHSKLETNPPSVRLVQGSYDRQLLVDYLSSMKSQQMDHPNDVGHGRDRALQNTAGRILISSNMTNDQSNVSR